jgi:hypothetical protein
MALLCFMELRTTLLYCLSQKIDRCCEADVSNAFIVQLRVGQAVVDMNGEFVDLTVKLVEASYFTWLEIYSLPPVWKCFMYLM